MLSDVFFIKDFYRGFNHLLKNGQTQVYNYEFKFNGELNACKKLMFATRPNISSLKGNNYLFVLIIFCLTFIHLFNWLYLN
jgi:bile salt-stimulated lipase